MSYFGVFDGHGGIDAAQYAAVHLHCILARLLRTDVKVPEALKQAFIETDKAFVDHANQEVQFSVLWVVVKCERLALIAIPFSQSFLLTFY
jgi:serine/threonine protein phosphatase PrpC